MDLTGGAPAMISILRYELALTLRRLLRRRAQTALMLTTFSVSIALCVVSWSLFHTMFLQNPDFDAQGELRFIGQNDRKFSAREVGFSRLYRSTREDIEAWTSQQSVFKDLAPVMLYNTVIIARVLSVSSAPICQPKLSTWSERFR